MTVNPPDGYWPLNDGRRTPLAGTRAMLEQRFERVKGILAPGVSLWCGCGYARNIRANHPTNAERGTSGLLVCARCDRA